MARSLSYVFSRPPEVIFDIHGGDGASTSKSLQPMKFPTPTKFYIHFTITQVHEFLLLLTRRRCFHRYAAAERGLVLERDAGGKISAAVWCGVAADALGGAAGLSAAHAEGLAKELAERLVDVDRGRERVMVKVEVGVVTQVVAALDAAVDAASVPVAAPEVAAREGCGFCDEPLRRDPVVRRARRCSHYFHWDCLAFLASRASRSCPRCNRVF